MPHNEPKTKPNDQSVDEFLRAIPDDRKRQDAYAILELMAQVTQLEPRMWGDSIVGFGEYHYKYASGREGDYFLTGFSPRKQYLTLYIMPGFEQYGDLLSRLGKFKTGESCLYINKLEEINLPVLQELVTKSFEHMVKTNPR